MEKLCMRTNLLINADAENSRDLIRIKEAKKNASALSGFAREFKHRKFDIADQPNEAGFTLLVEWESEKAMKHAKRLMELAEEMEKEANEFYEEIGIKLVGKKIKESKTLIL